MKNIKGIEIKKEVAFGKPVIAGTRVSVEFILELLSSGWTVNKIIKHYPHLKEADILAAINYSKELVKEWKGFPLRMAKT